MGKKSRGNREMIFILLAIWYWGFIQGMITGVILSRGITYTTSSRVSYTPRDQLKSIIEKNRHRIINSTFEE